MEISIFFKTFPQSDRFDEIIWTLQSLGCVEEARFFLRILERDKRNEQRNDVGVICNILKIFILSTHNLIFKFQNSSTSLSMNFRADQQKCKIILYLFIK